MYITSISDPPFDLEGILASKGFPPLLNPPSGYVPSLSEYTHNCIRAHRIPPHKFRFPERVPAITPIFTKREVPVKGYQLPFPPPRPYERYMEDLRKAAELAAEAKIVEDEDHEMLDCDQEMDGNQPDGDVEMSGENRSNEK
ncbi:hypothetical protein RUND412_008427 [Rhizina undulata]